MKKLTLQELVKIGKARKEKLVIQLNEYPWTKEQIIKSNYADFVKTTQIIDNSIGGKVFEEFLALKHSYEITISSINDLLLEIDKFIKHIKSYNFGYKRYKYIEEKFIFNLIKYIYFASSSIMTLVDYSRRIDKSFKIEDYKIEIGKNFDEKVHKFLQDLRNYVIHKNYTKPEWLIQGNEIGLEIGIKLNTINLLSDYSNWTKQSKEFIIASGEYIFIDSLFLEYKNTLINFYMWYFEQINIKYYKDIQEYKNNKKIVEEIQSINSWNLSFQVIKNKRDFYGFLNRNLKLNQIKEIIKNDGYIEKQVSLLKINFNFINEQLESKVRSFLSLEYKT